MPRVLSMQDLSCLGQCSLSAALPVLSACGCECAVLPTALLSTHTGPEFTPPHMVSLADHVTPIVDHWAGMGITFDGIQIGYLGRAELIPKALDAIRRLRREGTVVLADPVMGDHGVFYRGFDADYARAMRALCAEATLLAPNLTEAALLLGETPPAAAELSQCLDYARGLLALGASTVVLTGLELRPHQITNLVCCADGQTAQLNQIRLKGSYHGTGDLFSAALLGRLLAGDVLTEAVRRAGRFVSAAIARTPEGKRYGVCFEEGLKGIGN